MEQQRLFEGFEVQSQFARMKSWQIEDEDERHFVVGDTVVFCGTATVEPFALAFDKEGNLKRTNVLSPVVVRVASGALRNELVEMFGLLPEDAQLRLPASPGSPGLGPTTHVPETDDQAQLDEPELDVDPTTGEVLGPDDETDPEEALARFLAGGDGS